MTDNGAGCYSNKLLVKLFDVGINRGTDFHWRINSADARSSNGAGVPLTFVSRGRSGRGTQFVVRRPPPRDAAVTRHLDQGLCAHFSYDIYKNYVSLYAYESNISKK